MGWLKFFLVMMCCVGAFWLFNENYQAVRKYYPEMSMWDYFILSDKLRITPQPARMPY